MGISSDSTSGQEQRKARRLDGSLLLANDINIVVVSAPGISYLTSRS